MYGQVLIFQNAPPKRRYCKRHVSLGRSKRSARTHSYSREAFQMSSISPKRTFKTHKTQETTATVVKTPSERMTQNANSANFQNASFAKHSFEKRGSEFQNAVLRALSSVVVTTGNEKEASFTRQIERNLNLSGGSSVPSVLPGMPCRILSIRACKIALLL